MRRGDGRPPGPRAAPAAWPGGPASPGAPPRLPRPARGQGAFGLIELLVVAVIVALVGTALYSYLGSTARTLQGVQQQRPLSAARLTADRATVTALRTSLQLYYAQHGAYPASKDAVAALLTPAPSFQCEGNDFRYDPVTGTVSLLVDDPASC